MVYDSYLSGPYKNQTEYAIEYNKRMQIGLEKTFDFSSLNRLLNDMNGNAMSKTDSVYDLKLIPDNKNSMEESYNNHVSAKGSVVFYFNVIRRAKSLASGLINFLNKEYHLE